MNTVKLSKDILDSWLWTDKPFSKGQAYIDLLLNSSDKDKKVLFNSRFLHVPNGSQITSIRTLSNRWGWSNTKVASFLILLEKDNLIAYKNDSKKTVITIIDTRDNVVLVEEETTLKRHRNDVKNTIKEHKNDKLDKEFKQMRLEFVEKE